MCASGTSIHAGAVCRSFFEFFVFPQKKIPLFQKYLANLQVVVILQTIQSETLILQQFTRKFRN